MTLLCTRFPIPSPQLDPDTGHPRRERPGSPGFPSGTRRCRHNPVIPARPSFSTPLEPCVRRAILHLGAHIEAAWLLHPQFNSHSDTGAAV
jgi:hypothetical protein